MTRYRMEGTSSAVGIPVAAYFIGLSLFVLWLYSLLQPQYTPNPGLTAYKPPPATVISEMPTRLLAHHWQAPPSAEIETPAEEPKTAVVESKPEPTIETIEVKKPKRPKARDRDSPLNHYAASYRGYGSSRYSGNLAAAYPGYSGNRPF